jgi:hypothetical protein
MDDFGIILSSCYLSHLKENFLFFLYSDFSAFEEVEKDNFVKFKLHKYIYFPNRRSQN